MVKRKAKKTVKPEISEQQRLAALAERERLKEFIQFAKGDPRLSAWEANFLVSIQTFAYETPSDWILSEKRARVVQEITEKLHRPPPPDTDDEEPEVENDFDEASDPDEVTVREEERWTELLTAR